MHKLTAVGVASLTLSLAAFGALAQQGTYPNKPVTVVLPVTPASSVETEGRVHINKLSEMLGQPIVFDFKPGGGGAIGYAYAARAEADGYTLLLVSASYGLIPLRTTKLTFGGHESLAPVSLLSKRWGIIAMHPSVPGTVAEFTAYAKANPGKINFATSGAGTVQHLTGAWAADLAGADLTLVHYKSAAQIMPDLLSGRVHLTPLTLTSGIPHLKSGKLKALGMANLQRNPAFPDMPTVAEQGWKDFEYSSWLGLMAPVKTPTAIINLLSAEMAKVVKSPEVVKRLASETQLIGSTPAEFARHISTETERWRRLMKQSGITLAEE